MPIWLLPVINIVGPVLVKAAESIFAKKKSDDPQTGPQKKQYVLGWLIATWDLLEYLNFIPESLKGKRDIAITIFGEKIEHWVSQLKADGKI